MAAVVKKKGVARVVICNQPVERTQHVLSCGTIPRVMLIVGKNNHAEEE